MNRNRALIALVVAIVIAVIASRFVYRQIQQASAVKPLPVSHIVVASRPLALGTPLTAQDVELITWPEGTPLDGSFTRVQDCIGRSLITPISKNEPILESKLAPREAGIGLPAAIPVGMRAVSVRVDDVVGVSGFAMPGTMVDVLATGTPEGESDSLTRNIIQDVRVLAAGQTVEQDKQGKPHTVGVVTLLLTPKQADQLTMASTDNRIHLALRNTIDTKIEDKAEPVFKSALLLGGAQPHPTAGGGGKSRPRREATTQKPAGPAPFVVEVIRGDKKTNQTFSGQ
ncbi:MAG: Flp pilus assembly protein CpaB [Acidobacteria bacterium]|nr:MAG: Flp pilus assembly protein CpaB [Acidobacteriota bacterium]